MIEDEVPKEFLEAIEHLPKDIMRAKYDGNSCPEKKRTSVKKTRRFHATIDLHGFTREEALIVLKTALTRAKGKNRTLLVITGKGNNSEGGRGVIREAVLEYLAREGCAFIREFRFASSKNGGNGSIEIETK